jgi:CRISPR/Cas system-associated exonuclease Cas4 (RecB family)
MISNSEVSSWLHCTRKYYYEYFLNIEPKQLSEPLTKGTFIHAILEEYYAAKQLGMEEGDCRAAALQVVMDAAALPDANMVDIGQTRDLVFGYFDKYHVDDEIYEIVAVESKYKADLSPEFALVGTIDLVLRNKFTGKVIGVDHKSTYNFWTPDQCQTAGQFVKYIVLLRYAGIDINTFMVNQLRTRNVKNGDLWQRAFIHPTEARISNVMKQHIAASEKIMKFRAMGSPKELTVPVYDKYACSNCSFLPLCDSDTEGVNIDFQVASDYQPRTGYGYNEELLLG